MTNKVLTSSLVILTALGLAGCANSAAAPTTKTTNTNNTKVVKQDTSKAVNKTSEKAVSPKVTANSVSSNKVMTNSSSKVSSTSQAASQSSNTPNNDQQVLNSFVKTSGVQKDGNHYYVSKNKNNSNYQIEVRNNEGGDPNVAHLTGTYQYDPSTNQIHQMNPITGNYDD